MVDRLTTNHTSFFREARHFEILRKIVFPPLRSHSQIHIWSAACSTGEEPYSIAMSLLEESPREAAAKLRIRATDISTRVLDVARRGAYEGDRLDQIPAPLRARYMEEINPAGAGALRFKQHVRSLIDFRRLNLNAKLPDDYRCSLIFCRNVMIYFDRTTQQRLVQRLSQQIEDGGYLFIGHSESLNNIEHDLEYISPAIYRKPGKLKPARTGGR
jgi:chemotaxis protein methyltransferase CheR